MTHAVVTLNEEVLDTGRGRAVASREDSSALGELHDAADCRRHAFPVPGFDGQLPPP